MVFLLPHEKKHREKPRLLKSFFVAYARFDKHIYQLVLFLPPVLVVTAAAGFSCQTGLFPHPPPPPPYHHRRQYGLLKGDFFFFFFLSCLHFSADAAAAIIKYSTETRRSVPPPPKQILFLNEIIYSVDLCILFFFYTYV